MLSSNVEEEKKDETADDENEENSGVACLGTTIEQLCNSTMSIEDKNFYDRVILVEIGTPNFSFKFEKQERVFIGPCEWCNVRNQLTKICRCKRVRYCDEACMEKDKRFHIPQCSAQADAELNEVSISKSVNSKNGQVGLYNLGNTCYMNSSI